MSLHREAGLQERLIRFPRSVCICSVGGFKGTDTQKQTNKHLVSISAQLSALGDFPHGSKRHERMRKSSGCQWRRRPGAHATYKLLSRWQISGFTCIKSTQKINSLEMQPNSHMWIVTHSVTSWTPRWSSGAGLRGGKRLFIDSKWNTHLWCN